jgi:Leucine-rich repeat (LRR) protein
MSAKRDAAANEALRRILLARETGATELSLAGLSLEFLPKELGDLRRLAVLGLSRCEQLQDLRPLARLTAVQSLNLGVCKQLQDLRPLARLSALQRLNLSGFEQLQDLQPLAGLTALQSLKLVGCEQLQDLRPLAGLISGFVNPDWPTLII